MSWKLLDNNGINLTQTSRSPHQYWNYIIYCITLAIILFLMIVAFARNLCFTSNIIINQWIIWPFHKWSNATVVNCYVLIFRFEWRLIHLFQRVTDPEWICNISNKYWFRRTNIQLNILHLLLSSSHGVPEMIYYIKDLATLVWACDMYH